MGKATFEVKAISLDLRNSLMAALVANRIASPANSRRIDYDVLERFTIPVLERAGLSPQDAKADHA